MKELDPKLLHLLKSLRSDEAPALPPGLATRVAASWATCEDKSSGFSFVLQELAWRASFGTCMAALMLGLLMHDSWEQPAAANNSANASALELTQLENLMWMR